MSAPDTNISTQEKRHRPSLWGIKGAMIFSALLVILLLGFNMINSGSRAALSNGSPSNAGVTTVPTDVYAPGTNNAATPPATD